MSKSEHRKLAACILLWLTDTEKVLFSKKPCLLFSVSAGIPGACRVLSMVSVWVELTSILSGLSGWNKTERQIE